MSDTGDISLLHLLYAIFLAVVVGGVSYVLDLKVTRTVFISSVRACLQMFILAMVLQPALVYDNAILVIAIVFVQSLLAAAEAKSKAVYVYEGSFKDCWFSLTFVCSFSSIAAVYLILEKNALAARYLVPLSGMLIGATISSINIALKSLMSSVVDQGGVLEAWLALGGTRWEASLIMMQRALRDCMLPILNDMSIIGLIKIPGMMTGNLLAGTDPFTSAKYQVMVLFLIMFCVFCAGVAISALFVIRLFDEQHRLHGHRLTKLGKFNFSFSTIFMVLTNLRDRRVIGNGNNGSYSRVATSEEDEYAPPELLIDVDEPLDILPPTSGVCKCSATSLATTPHQPACFEHVCVYRWGKADGALLSSSSASNASINNMSSAAVMLEAKNLTVFVPPSSSSSSASSPSFASSSATATATPGSPVLGPGAVLFSLIKPLSFQLHAGQSLVMQGPSGVGKSTLLRSLVGLHAFCAGEVALHCPASFLSSSAASSAHLPSWRARISLISSRATLPGTVREYIDTANHFQARQLLRRSTPTNISNQKSLEGQNEVLREYMRAWLLPPETLERDWTSLSAGQHQRMLLAIALSFEPCVLLLDEVTSALDPDSTLLVETGLKLWLRGLPPLASAASSLLLPASSTPPIARAMLWVTHSREQAARVSTSPADTIVLQPRP